MLFDPPPFLIFLHIHKCGGMSIQRMLRRRYGPSVGKRLIRKLTGSEKGISDYTADDQFVQGHFGYGIHEIMPKPYVYFTLLRRPVSRLVSLYYHSRRYPTAYYHGHACDASLETFLLDTDLMELDNGMTRFLAGDPEDRFMNRTPLGECDASLLNKGQGKRCLRLSTGRDP